MEDPFRLSPRLTSVHHITALHVEVVAECEVGWVWGRDESYPTQSELGVMILTTCALTPGAWLNTHVGQKLTPTSTPHPNLPRGGSRRGFPCYAQMPAGRGGGGGGGVQL